MGEDMSVLVKRIGPSGRTTLEKFRNKHVVIFAIDDQEFNLYQTGTKSILEILKDRKEK